MSTIYLNYPKMNAESPAFSYDFSLADIGAAAEAFINAIGDARIFLFSGEMGTGKTTFISEVCRRLGVTDDVGSPTFSLVNEYSDANGNPVFHFDLYRIDSPEEVFEMGATDYFDSGALCLVEWPDRLGPLRHDDAVDVCITLNPDGSRKISF